MTKIGDNEINVFFIYIINCFYVDFISKVNLCQLKLLDASHPSLIEILKP